METVAMDGYCHILPFGTYDSIGIAALTYIKLNYFIFCRVPNIYNNGSVGVLYVETVAMDGDCHILPLVHTIQSVLQPRHI